MHRSRIVPYQILKRLGINMKLAKKFNQLKSDRHAMLAINYYNFETLNGVLSAARKMQAPIILQLTQSSIDYMGLTNAYNLGRSMLASHEVEGWIHLDHGGTVDLAKRCLDAGFDSVMYDGSELPFNENVKNTQEVVRYAAQFGANVEAELGYIAKLGQSSEVEMYTTPEQASEFVEKTGVNALAVAIGTAHGFYKKKPKLQFDLLQQIREATPAALVLHGGSGVPDEDLVQAIQLGICKINLATEVKNIFMRTLQQTLGKNDDIDLRKVFPRSTEAVTDLVANKIQVVYGK
ncbi:MAG: class II fructose-bisphosphate aldolase [Reichenbachiella sp.]|uniref:class II fructose-bisphosphate aldolase n=1 Tax=Reichenbachiella sp. TaxID=2184521 RepID=UPI00329A0CB3